VEWQVIFAIANEYDKMMTSIGAQGTNAFTSLEQTVYVNDIPQNNIEKWLAYRLKDSETPYFVYFTPNLKLFMKKKTSHWITMAEKYLKLCCRICFANIATEHKQL
jgi:hypothetical protein